VRLEKSVGWPVFGKGGTKQGVQFNMFCYNAHHDVVYVHAVAMACFGPPISNENSLT
jgi:hypothetical protein